MELTGQQQYVHFCTNILYEKADMTLSLLFSSVIILRNNMDPDQTAPIYCSYTLANIRNNRCQIRHSNAKEMRYNAKKQTTPKSVVTRIQRRSNATKGAFAVLELRILKGFCVFKPFERRYYAFFAFL